MRVLLGVVKSLREKLPVVHHVVVGQQHALGSPVVPLVYWILAMSSTDHAVRQAPLASSSAGHSGESK